MYLRSLFHKESYIPIIKDFMSDIHVVMKQCFRSKWAHFLLNHSAYSTVSALTNALILNDWLLINRCLYSLFMKSTMIYSNAKSQKKWVVILFFEISFTIIYDLLWHYFKYVFRDLYSMRNDTHPRYYFENNINECLL